MCTMELAVEHFVKVKKPQPTNIFAMIVIEWFINKKNMLSLWDRFYNFRYPYH